MLLAQHDPELAISRLLDRAMPAPMVVASVVLTVVSEHTWWTLAGATLLVVGNIVLNVLAGRTLDITVVGWLRTTLVVGVVPLIVFSVGPVSGAWLIAIPPLVVLPLIVPTRPRWVPSVLLMVLTGIALWAAGWGRTGILVGVTSCAISALVALPVMSSLRGLVGELAVAGRALQDRTVTLDQARVAAERAQQRAEHAMQVRSAFLANVSHELRTPISGIIGLLDHARGAPGEREEDLDLARGASHHLLGVVNDILDLARLESGKVELTLTSTDVGELVREVARVAQVGRGGAVPVDVQVDPDVGWRLVDEQRLRQVLLNLVSNALKFTHEGSVSVVVSTCADRVCFTVQDTGIGMDTEQAERVFEPFEQADNGISRRYGGTGLGLAIAKRLVESHEGTVCLTTAPGEGSRFDVTLPLRAVAAPTPDVVDRHLSPGFELAGLRVLVAEDNVINQLVIRRTLERLGCVVEVVADGHQAVDAVEAAAPDLVLMDIQMPLLDGPSATRVLRENGHQLPIVALTANVMPEDRALALASGMDGYLTKPVDVDALVDLLRTTQDARAVG